MACGGHTPARTSGRARRITPHQPVSRPAVANQLLGLHVDHGLSLRASRDDGTMGASWSSGIGPGHQTRRSGQWLNAADTAGHQTMHAPCSWGADRPPLTLSSSPPRSCSCSCCAAPTHPPPISRLHCMRVPVFPKTLVNACNKSGLGRYTLPTSPTPAGSSQPTNQPRHLHLQQTGHRHGSKQKWEGVMGASASPPPPRRAVAASVHDNLTSSTLAQHAHWLTGPAGARKRSVRRADCSERHACALQEAAAASDRS